MASRPVWRGHLRLALVSCPIALQTVHRSTAGIHFHFINPDTGNRVRQVTVDAGTDEELSRGDLARGYEYEKDRYVIIDEEDFETARVESSSLLAIDKFVPVAEIDPIYYDQSYYVTPDAEQGGGADVYVVLRDAIARTGKVALSRLVIARRERAVALHPLGRGLVLHTLHDAADVASADEAFSGVPSARPEADMVDLARQLIERQTGGFDPADLTDRYEARLREVIDAKIRGEDPDPPPGHANDDDNVVDLMAALRRSLGQSAPAAPARRSGTAAGADASQGASRPAGGKAGASGAGAGKGVRATPATAKARAATPTPAPPKRDAAKAGPVKTGGSKRGTAAASKKAAPPVAKPARGKTPTRAAARRRA